MFKKKIRYIIAGGWNTIFGYFFGIFLFYFFKDNFPLIFILIVINIVAISMSFLTYKLYVFKTKGNWIREFIKSFLVYGSMSLISIPILLFLVDVMFLPFWLSQGITIIITIIFSYILHKNFTFKI